MNNNKQKRKPSENLLKILQSLDEERLRLTRDRMLKEIEEEEKKQGTMKEVAKLIKKYGSTDIYLADYGVILSDGRKVQSVHAFSGYKIMAFVVNKGGSGGGYIQDTAISEEDAKKIYDAVLLDITRAKTGAKSQLKKSIHKFEKHIKEIDKELEELKKLKRK